MKLVKQNARSLANDIRIALGYAQLPQINFTNIINYMFEEYGMIVSINFNYEPNEEYMACSLIDNNTVIIYANLAFPREMQNLGIAIEIGNFLYEGPAFNRHFHTLNEDSNQKKEVLMSFASELLMPQKMLFQFQEAGFTDDEIMKKFEIPREVVAYAKL